MHLGTGGPKKHTYDNHNQALITRNMLEEGTTVVRRETDENRLAIIESILIQAKNPMLNRQATGQARTLKLFNLPLILPNQ